MLNALLLALFNPVALATRLMPLAACKIFRLAKAARPVASVVALVTPASPPPLFRASDTTTPDCAALVPALSLSCTTTLVMPAPTTVFGGWAEKESCVAAAINKFWLITKQTSPAATRFQAVVKGFIFTSECF